MGNSSFKQGTLTVTNSQEIPNLLRSNDWQGTYILWILAVLGLLFGLGRLLAFLPKLFKIIQDYKKDQSQQSIIDDSLIGGKTPHLQYFSTASLPEDLEIVIPLPNHPSWDRDPTQIEPKRNIALIYSYDITDIKNYCLLLNHNGTKLEKIAGTTKLDPAIISSWIEQEEKIKQLG